MQNHVLDIILRHNKGNTSVKDYLQEVSTNYPYFTPAHFFLLQQLPQTDDAFTEQAAKTSLFFNNPHWLQFKLHQLQSVGKPVEKAEAEVAAPVVVEEQSKNEAVFLSSREETLPQQEEIFPVKEEILPVQAANLSIKEETLSRQEEIFPIKEEILPQQIENPSEKEENFSLQKEESLPLQEETPLFKEEEVVLPKEETDAAQEQNNSDNSDADAIPVQEEPLKEPEIKIDLAAMVITAENTDAPSFEPMHLVDYFASQGIKLNEELQTADKLSKQLKSFTEWLKTMKRVHVPAGAVTGSEIAVQALAEKSNIDNEVLTEAMAAVYEQQGKADKALELYRKLSLINPSKSAYFAAKIENLKGV